MKKKYDLTHKRIINFLRHIKDTADILAVELINEQLDKNKSLNDILKKENGFFVNSRKISDNKYKIEFGCQAGPEAGDGGKWTVSFDEKDNVVECGVVDTWMS